MQAVRQPLSSRYWCSLYFIWSEHFLYPLKHFSSHCVSFLINQTSTHFTADKTYAIVPFIKRYECEGFLFPLALVILLLKVIPFNLPGNVHFDFSLLSNKLFITKNSLCSCIQVPLQSDLYFLCQSEQWRENTDNKQNVADNRGEELQRELFLAMTIFSLDLTAKIFYSYNFPPTCHKFHGKWRMNFWYRA